MKSIYSLGVMTGTSCDGADFAALDLSHSGKTVTESVIGLRSIAFPSELRRKLKLAQRGMLKIPEVATLTREYSIWIGRNADKILRQWRVPRKFSILSVHGQTVWHQPKHHFSVQLLDPAIVEFQTKCTVLSSFRQADLARGGEGAPLVPLYHWFRAHEGGFGNTVPFAIHNVGGIANVTVITKSRNQIFGFDTGPGNALIDLAVEKISKGNVDFDKDGQMASAAYRKINWEKIYSIGQNKLFRTPPPKSMGREQFFDEYLRKLPGNNETLVANATALTAHTMALAYELFIFPKFPLKAIFLAGGGAYNKTLLQLFRAEIEKRFPNQIPITILPEDFAPAQFLEATAFARLGYEALLGREITVPNVTGAKTGSHSLSIFSGDNYLDLLRTINKILKQ